MLTSLVGLFCAAAWRLNIDMPAGSGDRWPEDYARGRPSYPSEVVDIPGLPFASTVLDLGAGTGKLTRLLVATFGRVVAVEPAEAMRGLLARLCPEAQVLAGSAEEIRLADASVDAVFAAEAFQWFDGERTLAEIARVLRPRGALDAPLLDATTAQGLQDAVADERARLRQRPGMTPERASKVWTRTTLPQMRHFIAMCVVAPGDFSSGHRADSPAHGE